MKCRELTLFPFRDVLSWVKQQQPTEANPLYVSKYGGRSNLDFRVWHFAGCLLLMSNEKAKKQSQYIITPEKWKAFWGYVKNNPEMGTGELAHDYKKFGCTNKLFWPSIISICKQYTN